MAMNHRGEIGQQTSAGPCSHLFNAAGNMDRVNEDDANVNVQVIASAPPSPAAADDATFGADSPDQSDITSGMAALNAAMGAWSFQDAGILPVQEAAPKPKAKPKSTRASTSPLRRFSGSPTPPPGRASQADMVAERVKRRGTSEVPPARRAASLSPFALREPHSGTSARPSGPENCAPSASEMNAEIDKKFEAMGIAIAKLQESVSTLLNLPEDIAAMSQRLQGNIDRLEAVALERIDDGLLNSVEGIHLRLTTARFWSNSSLFWSLEDRSELTTLLRVDHWRWTWNRHR